MIQFETVRLYAPGAHLDMRGSITLGQEHLNLAIFGASPLAIIGAWIPAVRFQQGVGRAEVSIRGSLRNPVLEGEALVQAGAVCIAALNEPLCKVTGTMRFSGQTLAIQSLTGRLAGGHIAVAGAVRLQRLQLDDMRLSAEVTRVRLRHPAGFLAALDAALVATGTSHQQRVIGGVTHAQARYRQELDLVLLVHQFRQGALEPPSKAEESLQFDIRVATRDPLRLENSLSLLVPK